MKSRRRPDLQTIDAQIKTGELARFHLVYGEEPYMVRYYKNKLKTALSKEGDDMNASFFEGESIPLEEVASLGQTLPFFANERLILMENTGLFQSSNEVASMLADFPDTTYVVFVEMRVDKRNRLYKWIQKNGCVTECAPQPEKDLIPWVAAYLKRNGKTCSRRTAEYCLAKIGFQMDRIIHELDKLIGYTGDRAEVTAADVDAICPGQTVGKIFDMIDAVIAGENEMVFRLYGDLLELKEPPPVILHLLGRHINILIQIKESGTSMPDRDVAKKIGIPSFTVKKYKSQAAHFSRHQLLSLLEQRTDCEERFKTGKLSEKLVAEIFLLQTLKNRKI